MKTIHLIWRRSRWLCVVVCLYVFSSYSALADTRIAVLHFELKDMTLLPQTSEELERTALMKPLLEKFIKSTNDYELVKIDSDDQLEANVGFGYLFNHPDATAELGNKFGAEWVVVGRIHKPSFLFVYFMAHLVNVKTQRLVGSYVIEVKGPQKKLTEKGVEYLARQIDKTIKP
ncbi:hypothetical protein NKDENANG_03916 [Candidatus Entotheonellaceae bacterium PAL068K]